VPDYFSDDVGFFSDDVGAFRWMPEAFLVATNSVFFPGICFRQAAGNGKGVIFPMPVLNLSGSRDKSRDYPAD